MRNIALYDSDQRSSSPKAKGTPLVLRRRHDPVHLFQGGAQGFLAHEPPDTGTDGGLDLVGVVGLPRGDADDVGSDLLEHLAVVVVAVDVAPQVSPSLLELLPCPGVSVGNGYDSRLRHLGKGRRPVVASGCALYLPVHARERNLERVFRWHVLCDLVVEEVALSDYPTRHHRRWLVEEYLCRRPSSG